MDNLANSPVTQALTKANLAAGTTNTLTFSAMTYAIRGKMYSRAALTNGATPTTDFATGKAFNPVGPNQGSVFVVAIDTAGVLRVVQGSTEQLDGAGTWVNLPQFPGVPDTSCAIGYIMVRVGSTGSAFTFGSSNLSGATGVTYSFTDLSMMPDRPQAN